MRGSLNVDGLDVRGAGTTAMPRASHQGTDREVRGVERQGTSYDVAAVEAFAGTHVRVHLDDGSEHTGHLRTELLSDRSLSVYITGSGDEGATLYIDQIVAIVPLSSDPVT
jgi:hypothetical protein